MECLLDQVTEAIEGRPGAQESGYFASYMRHQTLRAGMVLVVSGRIANDGSSSVAESAERARYLVARDVQYVLVPARLQDAQRGASAELRMRRPQEAVYGPRLAGARCQAAAAEPAYWGTRNGIQTVDP